MDSFLIATGQSWMYIRYNSKKYGSKYDAILSQISSPQLEKSLWGWVQLCDYPLRDESACNTILWDTGSALRNPMRDGSNSSTSVLAMCASVI
eukprot:4881078-Pyramimonas_sp.AAC.1